MKLDDGGCVQARLAPCILGELQAHGVADAEERPYGILGRCSVVDIVGVSFG